MSYMQKCIVCGLTCGPDPVGFQMRHGYICMRHEGQTMEVFEVEHYCGKYIDKDADSIVVMVQSELENCEVGDSFTVTKREIPVVQYYGLPEFGGF